MDQPLHVFVTVVEKRNFSRAAEELHMTQPAVSQYIKNLEESLGTKLLERSNRSVELNKAGEIVYHHAKELLNLYSKMNYLLDDLTNRASGKITIGASYTYGEYVLPHVIAKIRHNYPLITPSITIGNSTEIGDLVYSHQLDVGIIEGDYPARDMKVDDFTEDEMVIVGAPSHGQVENGSILENEMWIVREAGSGTREATEKMWKQLEITPANTMAFGSTQLIKESVEAGIGISFLSRWTIRKELELGSLVVLTIPDFTYTRTFSILMRSPFQTKVLEVFLEHIHDHHIH
ncbi:LysR substrate-binding domain-containing protein [Alkalihalobacillus macyae]|uniref:LysR substrate-binding domain-containing protein n=1 Tax=Guptibacillus hwajinpoensis TaxID=208199 RepID=UPI00273CC8C3|nr:LysR substrate-binding domain-containing protein [Alkalihalobacillus macyae]MDP4549992.1 LysR substrate-binding domain-containing protein [Alkalihalobacillus macyae]